MKREIKFRAWDGYEYDFMPTIWNGLVWNPREDCEIKGVIIEQFTGLLDKNGKEIYEGDFIKGRLCGYVNIEVKQVEWGEKEVCFHPLSMGDSCGCCSDAFDINEVEVIGNIHENPELIK